jgi:enoyl-CoA hydratase/carnithine racemase
MTYYTPEQIGTLSSVSFAHLLLHEEGHVLTITLNRPEKKNALNPTLIAELAFALSYAHHARSVRVVVLAAAGDVWCAGMDLKALQSSAEASTSTVPPPAGTVRLGELMAAFGKPCVARVHAPVYAGGVLLVAGATHVVASEEAAFGLPEVKRGLFPFQVLDSLLQLGLPTRPVLDWCLRGTTLRAAEAQALGLLTRCVAEAELDEAVGYLVAELVAVSPTAQQYGLRAYQALRTLPAAERQAYLFEQFQQIQQTADAREGLVAFAEKRPPVWGAPEKEGSDERTG